MNEYLEKIVNNGNPEDMQCLSNIMIELLENLKETNARKYKYYKNKIKGMAYNYELDEELSIEIVNDMSPIGEEWDLETVKNVTAGNPHSLYDLYVVMNSLANDYSGIIPVSDATTYINLANAWLDDEDAPDHKVWWYFMKKD